MKNLVPHRGGARLLTCVVECGPDAIVAEGAVDPGSPYVTDGTVPAYVALDLAAQAAAAMETIEGRRRGGCTAPRPGFLVRARRLRLQATTFVPSERLTVTVRRVGGAGRLRRYEARVVTQTGPLLSGDFSTFGPDFGAETKAG